MEFRILGPLEVLDGERRVDIAGAKQRFLTTALALAPGRVVSADRLMEELWRDQPPSGGVKSLHYHVFRLRDALQPDRAPGEEGVLITRPPGYALMVSPDDVDAVRFERTVRDARRLAEFDPARAAADLRDALDLWRGPLPAELFEAPATGLEARRLEELRLSALEDCIDADLATGRHAEVIPDLEALVREHPLRERLWALLMVALYRTDRQGEALRAYQELRTHLAEELGIDPSPDIQQLEEAILQQDPDLDVPEGLQRPSSLRGYELRERIGEGAFGVVWRASQRSVDREVAVKVVRPEYSNRPDSVLGFQAQARLLAALEHPHVVPVFDFWRDPDGAYLVMPLMLGGSLDVTDTESWESPRVVRLIEQITSGLAHAHRLGLVHADLHPGNVLFDGDGNSYLADFGLVANLSGGTSTPPEAFASPEQVRGEPATPASDVYGLGRLAHRVLAGSDPGAAPLQPIRTARPDVRAAVDTVLRRATDPDPTRRYSDAGEFLDDFRRAVGEEPAPIVAMRNPYKGLRAFGEIDAPDFFGRNDLIEELLGRVGAHRLVAVVGSSGSGKSSLVRAGLIPALRAGRIEGAAQWVIADMYPGADPLAALVTALRTVAIEDLPESTDPIWGSDQVGPAVHRAMPGDAEVVLVVDQFEELFTLCSSEPTRRCFLDVVLALSGDDRARIRFVLTLRADYFGKPLEYPAMAEALHDAVVTVATPAADELTQAIVAPAAGVGIDVEPELAADLVGDVAAEPGALPLLEYTLTRLFEERPDGGLTVAAYRRLGGLAEALAGWPEALFGDLDPAGREACSQIFLRLLSVDEAGRETRRRVALRELHDLGIDRAVVDEVLRRFTDARLLTQDRDPESREAVVEVAHEALLSRWVRLRGWVEERRESLLLQRRFRAALGDWEQAGRDAEFLLSGGRLRQFEVWSDETDLAFTPEEREFLQASRQRERAAESVRQRRRRLTAATLGVLAAAAVAFGIFAFIERGRATDQQAIAEEQAAIAVEQAAVAEAQERIAEEQAVIAAEQASVAAGERDNAEAQERIARAKSLAGASAANLEADPELAVLLAIEAVETTRGPDGNVLREAEEALHAAVSADRLLWTAPVDMFAWSAEYSPDGNRLFVSGLGAAARIFDAATGRLESDFDLSPQAVIVVAGAESELLVVSRLFKGVAVLDGATLEELVEGGDDDDELEIPTLQGGSAMDLAVGGDGTILAGIDPYEGKVYVWDLEQGALIAEFEDTCPTCSRGWAQMPDGTIMSMGNCSTTCSRGVALSPDGTMVTSGNTLWAVESGEVVLSEISTSQVLDVEMLDDTRMIIADGPSPRVVDITGATRETLRGHESPVSSIDIGPGGMVATGGQDGLVMVWEQKEFGFDHTMSLRGGLGTVWDVQFSPDGSYLTSVSGRSQFPLGYGGELTDIWEARTWEIAASGGGEVLAAPAGDADVSFSPDGGSVVVADPVAGASIWDIESGAESLRFGDPAAGNRVTAVAFAPGGSQVALAGLTAPGGEEKGWVAVFDTATGAMLRELVAPTAAMTPRDLSFSLDGTQLAVAGYGLAAVWDTTSWEVVLTPSDHSQFEDGSLASEYTAIALDPKGEFLFLQFRYYNDLMFPSAELRDLQTGELRFDFGADPRGDHGSMDVSSDGRLLLTAGSDRPTIWAPFVGRDIARLEATPANAVTAVFSADGTRIASGESDGTVRLWDAATAEELLVLRGHTRMVVDVAFSPDGRRLASVARDGTMRIWALDVDELLTIARSRVGRELTDLECRLYVGVGCPPAPGPEVLVPQTADWTQPYGIDQQAWEDAAAGGSWSKLAFELPGGGSLVLDTRRHTLHVINDGPTTWLLDLETGTTTETAAIPGVPDPDLPPDFPPPEAAVNAAVYHEGLDLIVATRADDGATFAIDPVTGQWSELVPPLQHLAGRYGYGLVYDAESELIVLFGGAFWGRTEDGKHAGLGDTWVLDVATATWTEVTPQVSPPPRRNVPMAYDSESDRIVLFAGSTHLFGDVLGDTWVYDTNTNVWTEMSPATSPPARVDPALWYDAIADTVFVFGGTADARWPGLPWMQMGAEELWGYDVDSDTWTLFRVDPNPGYRSGAGAFFDPVTGTGIVIGGDFYDADRRYQGGLDDIWTYRHDGEG